MYSEDKIWVSRNELEKVCLKLKGLKLVLKDNDLKDIINESIEILDKEIKYENTRAEGINVEQLISNKMVNTKYSNPDLNFILYKLLRRLQNKQIDENEAMRIYEMYTQDIDK